jgi:hypothetical protein
MATAIGTNVVTSLVNRWLMPTVTDNTYRSVPLLFRLNAANKRMVRGGTQFEAPLMYAQFTNGGSYTGYDALDAAPNDTVKNAAWDWRQYYVPVTIDGLTLMKVETPEAVADVVKVLFAQAEMQMAEMLGQGVWSNGSNLKNIDGLQWAVDDGTEASATYGGISRTANTWWNCQIDTATTATTMASLQLLFGKCSEGGRTPTIIFSPQANYNFYWALNAGTTSLQRFPSEPAGQDVQLAAAGFSNLLFNGTPWLVDSHCQTSHVYMLNEDYISLGVHPRADFYLQDFQQPVNQDAMVSLLLWGGQLLMTNCARSGKMTALTS